MEADMLQRRDFLSGLGRAGIAAAATAISSASWAQRPTHPIARPGAALLQGRFNPGVSSGAVPGIYVVVAVDPKAETLHLRDEGGRTGVVRVKEDLFDIATLKPGDEV